MLPHAGGVIHAYDCHEVQISIEMKPVIQSEKITGLQFGWAIVKTFAASLFTSHLFFIMEMSMQVAHAMIKIQVIPMII